MTSAEKIRSRIMEVRAALPAPEKDVYTAAAASAILKKRESIRDAFKDAAPKLDKVVADVERRIDELGLSRSRPTAPGLAGLEEANLEQMRKHTDAKLSQWRRLVTWWEAMESLLTSAVVARDLQPLQDRVIVRRIKPETRSKGGIHLVDEAVSPSMQGYVIAIGTGRVRSSGMFLPTEVRVGDRIIFGRFTTEITVDGEEYDIVREDEILAVFEPFAPEA